MGHDNIDKEIKKKLEERLIEPSGNAWGKLDELLDKEENSKNIKSPFYWLAASIVLLLGLFFTFEGLNDNKYITPVVVEAEKEKNTVIKDEPLILPNKEDKKQEIAIEQPNEVIVKQNTPIKRIKQHINNNKKELPTAYEINDFGIKKHDELIALNHKKEEDNKGNKHDLDSEVDYLLAAATADIAVKEENKASKKTTVKTTIDPNVLLADVEEELDMSFKEKVFKKIKSGFKKTKTAVAKRND